MRTGQQFASLAQTLMLGCLPLPPSLCFPGVAGFPYSDTANYEPFLPYGVRGVFAGAAVVFFSFIGFDTVSALLGALRAAGGAQRRLGC